MPHTAGEPSRWTDAAPSVGRAVLLMFLAWMGSMAWRTYESVQESRAQNQVILIRMEKLASLERQVGDALHRIEVAGGTVAAVNSRLMVLESRLAEHEQRLATHRSVLLRLDESRGREAR
jgi:hypothetical protein